MRALLSVYDKAGIEPFARGLAGLGWDLVSTGGTYRTLAAAGLGAGCGARRRPPQPPVSGAALAARLSPFRLPLGDQPLDTHTEPYKMRTNVYLNTEARGAGENVTVVTGYD